MNILEEEDEGCCLSSLFQFNDRHERTEPSVEGLLPARNLLETSLELIRRHDVAQAQRSGLITNAQTWVTRQHDFKVAFPEPPLTIFDDFERLEPYSQHAVSEPVPFSVRQASPNQQLQRNNTQEQQQAPLRPHRRLSVRTFRQSSEEQPDCGGNGCRIVSKNQTKNIPKNYGKAIITFIERNRGKVTELLHSRRITYQDLMDELRRKKKNINTIADLRSLWTESRYSQEIRMLSCLFLRKHSLQYIFNSRVSNFASHIKYRAKLREALTDPQGFRNIKDY